MLILPWNKWDRKTFKLWLASLPLHVFGVCMCIHSTMLDLMKCFTYNVPGLCNAKKWRLFQHYVHNTQPDMVCLQEHNQHSLAGQQGFFSWYKNAGTGNSSWVCTHMIYSHWWPLMIPKEDGQGIINGDIYEFAPVYASQTSAYRAHMWDSISQYPWRSTAFLCED